MNEVSEFNVQFNT